MKSNMKSEPIYTIGVASRLAGLSPNTLRIWEKKELIKPQRIGKNRFYSECDMEQLKLVKNLLQEEGLNIQGVKLLLKQQHCWDIKKCKGAVRDNCIIYKNYLAQLS